MLLIDEHRYITAPFDSELELETIVLQHHEYIFGPDSILLPKKLIKSPDGAGTIPDAFAIDLEGRRWFLVEAELATHGVWTHIAPQVAKQLVAAQEATTRELLVEQLVQLCKSDTTVADRFADHGIDVIDVRSAVADIVRQPPIIAIPIDSISRDLRLWAEQLAVEVRLWIVRKLVDFENPERVAYEIPDEFSPTVDTGKKTETSITVYDVAVVDLIDVGLLEAGQVLTMPYKPRGGEQHHFEAVLRTDGSLELLGEVFSSPSYAAIRAINSAGSPRSTANGWVRWRTGKGQTLAELRDRYLSGRIKPSE